MQQAAARPPKEPYSLKKLQGKEEIKLAIAWLQQKYEIRDSGSLSKLCVFEDYLSMCKHNGVEPTTCSVFGKIVRMAFPTIACSRKGPRGSSKHHYKHLHRKQTGTTVEDVDFSKLDFMQTRTSGSSAAPGQSAAYPTFSTSQSSFPAAYSPMPTSSPSYPPTGGYYLSQSAMHPTFPGASSSASSYFNSPPSSPRRSHSGLPSHHSDMWVSPSPSHATTTTTTSNVKSLLPLRDVTRSSGSYPGSAYGQQHHHATNTQQEGSFAHHSQDEVIPSSSPSTTPGVSPSPSPTFTSGSSGSLVFPTRPRKNYSLRQSEFHIDVAIIRAPPEVEYELSSQAVQFSLLYQVYYQNLFEAMASFDMAGVKKIIEGIWQESKKLKTLFSYDQVNEQIAAIDRRYYPLLAQTILQNRQGLTPHAFYTNVQQLAYYLPVWNRESFNAAGLSNRLGQERERTIDEFATHLQKLAAVSTSTPYAPSSNTSTTNYQPSHLPPIPLPTSVDGSLPFQPPELGQSNSSVSQSSLKRKRSPPNSPPSLLYQHEHHPHPPPQPYALSRASPQLNMPSEGPVQQSQPRHQLPPLQLPLQQQPPVAHAHSSGPGRSPPSSPHGHSQPQHGAHPSYFYDINSIKRLQQPKPPQPTPYQAPGAYSPYDTVYMPMQSQQTPQQSMPAQYHSSQQPAHQSQQHQSQQHQHQPQQPSQQQYMPQRNPQHTLLSHSMPLSDKQPYGYPPSHSSHGNNGSRSNSIGAEDKDDAANKDHHALSLSGGGSMSNNNNNTTNNNSSNINSNSQRNPGMESPQKRLRIAPTLPPLL